MKVTETYFINNLNLFRGKSWMRNPSKKGIYRPIWGCFQALRVLFAILRSYGLLYLRVRCMKEDVSWALPQWFCLGVITSVPLNPHVWPQSPGQLAWCEQNFHLKLPCCCFSRDQTLKIQSFNQLKDHASFTTFCVKTVK